MPDYIMLFCMLVDNGSDMSDVRWSDFQEAAAELLFEDMTPEGAWVTH